MKKFLLPVFALFFFSLVSCGPAAEDRAQMHGRAKTIADSMANLIRTAMQEAEMPAGYQAPAVVSSSPTGSAAPQGSATATPTKP